MGCNLGNFEPEFFVAPVEGGSFVSVNLGLKKKSPGNDSNISHRKGKPENNHLEKCRLVGGYVVFSPEERHLEMWEAPKILC